MKDNFFVTRKNRRTMSDPNYPPMSQSEWERAPWNQVELPERKFQVTVCQALSKSGIEVLTNDYNPEYEEETGITYSDTSETDWKEVYHENDYHTPLQLIGLFKKYLEDDMENIPENKRTWYKHLIQECEDWVEDEIDIMED